MADTSEASATLSRKLCRILDYVGVSESMRKVWMEYGLATEAFLAMRTHFMKRPLDMFKFGSGIEGSTVPGLHSDLDLLLLHNIPVVTRMEDAPGSGICYLVVCDPSTPAGFVKFQVVKDGVKLTDADKDKVDSEENYGVDKHGRLARNNNTLLQDKLNNAWRSGPAQTCEDKNFGSIDYVEAYHSAVLPETVSEWMRTQHGDCTNRSVVTHDQLAEFESMGCFFVGIGHPKSDESHLEWRISLSSQERTLMFNMNSVQFKCYVMLKILKEEFIKPSTEKALSSYHCKTALFHVIKKESPNFWMEENLIGAVFHCLAILLEWVKQGDCPNFFVRKENMFERKLNSDIGPKLATVLDGLIQKGSCILYDIKCDKIGTLLVEGCEHIKEGEMTTEAWKNLYRIHLDTVCEFDQSKARVYGLLAGDSNPENCSQRISDLVTELETMESLKLHDTSGIMSGVQYFMPSARMALGSNMIACALQNDVTDTERSTLIENGMTHFKKGFDPFCLSGKLKYASCLLALGKLKESSDILTDLEKNIVAATTTACACRHIEYDMNQDMVQNLSRDNPSTRELARTSICMCVSFQPSEIALTPFPLRFEMFRSVGTPENSVGGFGVYWYPSACVDAKVFLYFLKYLVHSAMNKTDKKRESVKCMIQLAEDDPALNHRETAFNLLAWISKTEGCVDEAVKYCVKSWQYLVAMEEKVVSSVHPHHNAVKWHVISLMCDVWRATSRD